MLSGAKSPLHLLRVMPGQVGEGMSGGGTWYGCTDRAKNHPLGSPYGNSGESVTGMAANVSRNNGGDANGKSGRA